MRLNRYLASAGLGSRRACETLILSGRVQINGARVTNLATAVETADVVSVDGRKIIQDTSVYYVLNKPKGYLCTATDPRGRPTIYQLLPAGVPRMFYVGRLDSDSEGLVLMTNDGTLAQSISHPSRHIEKEYEVLLDHPLDPVQIPKLLKGFVFEEGRARMADVRLLAPKKVRVILRQGMKRQIRRMFYRLGLEVIRLVRVRIGPLQLHSLPHGASRPLSHRELNDLRASAVEGATRQSKPRIKRIARASALEKTDAPREPREPGKTRRPRSRMPGRKLRDGGNKRKAAHSPVRRPGDR